MAQKRLADISRALSEAKTQQRLLKRNARRRVDRHEAAFQRHLMVGVLAYTHDPSGLVTYAEHVSRCGGTTRPITADEACRQITERFLGMPNEVLGDWLDWTCAGMTATAVKTAQNLVREFGLVEWVKHQNKVQGVAPPQCFVWQRRCAEMNKVEDCDAVRPREAASSARAVKWMQRFRARHDLRLGKQPVGHILPVEHLQQKADVLASCIFVFLTSKN